jgi:hypothetical protein
MNMLAHQRQQIEPPPPPAEKLPMLDFGGAKRAGRAVADLHGMGVIATRTCVHSLSWGQGLWHRISMSLRMPHPTLAEMPAFFIFSRGLVADPPTVHTRDDAEDEFVDWLSDAQADAETAIASPALAAPDAPEPQGEVVLTRRGRPRSMSWRGGGTMHRR